MAKEKAKDVLERITYGKKDKGGDRSTNQRGNNKV